MYQVPRNWWYKRIEADSTPKSKSKIQNNICSFETSFSKNSILKIFAGYTYT